MKKLKKKFFQRSPKNSTELEIALKEEWSKIPQEKYLNLIENMPRRIEACISNKGWATKY